MVNGSLLMVHVRKALLLVCLLISVSTPALMAQDAKKLLKEGETALDHGVYSFAQKQFEQYLAEFGETIKPQEYEKVLNHLLRSLHEQKKFEDVQRLLNEVDKKRISDRGLLVFWRTLVEYEKGEYAQALKEVNLFKKNYPESEFLGRAERLRAWCYYKSGDAEKALVEFEVFDKKFGKSPDSPDNLIEWAKTLMTVGQDEKAAEVLNRLVRIKKELRAVREGQLWLGRLYLKRSNYKQAVTILTTLADNNNAAGDLRAEALYSSAYAHGALTNLPAAVNAVARGVELASNPGIKSLGNLELGTIYLERNNIEKGAALLKVFISEFPDDPASSDAQLELAKAFLDTAKYDLSVNEFQYYTETFTNTFGLAEAHFGKGWGLSHLGRQSESAIEFQKAYDLFTDPVRKEESLFKVGDSYFRNNQYKLAADAYGLLMKVHPASRFIPDASFQLAESQARDEKYDKAEEVFRALVASYPESQLAEEALLRIAEMKVKQGLLRDATTLYTSLTTLYPKSKFMPDVLFGRGNIYFQQWRFNKAMEDFERIAANHPESDVVEEAYYKQGMCHYWIGQDETTLKVFNSFIEKYPKSNLTPAVFFWVGRYHFNHGQFKDSEKAFNDFAEKYKDHALAADALLWKGYSLIKRREYKMGVETLAAMIKDYPNSSKMPDARFAQGEALCEMANYDAAILIFGEIINKYPESPLVISAWLGKGDCQFILGGDDQRRYKESMGSYRVVINSSNARAEQVVEAEYKTARSLEKTGRTAESFEYYYQKILLRSIDEREKGVRHNESSRLWMTKAAYAASGIAEDNEEFKAAVSILELMLKIGGEAAPDAKRRIEKIKSEHWWLFY